MSNLRSSVEKLGWLKSKLSTSASKKGSLVKIVVVGRQGQVPSSFLKSAPTAVKVKMKEKVSVVNFETNGGKQWLIQLQWIDGKNHYGHFNPSPYAMARDLMGTCMRQILSEAPGRISLEYIGDSEEELRGLCVGMEMAQYQFKSLWPQVKKNAITLQVKSSLKRKKSCVEEGALLGEAVNFSRLLVDLPPNELQPQDYADLLKATFDKKPKTKVEVWNASRLLKEKMGLHIAVGQAARQQPHMVCVRYRGAGKEVAPLAFVGKGITFDSGGLDIKPSSGMRLMKKDMGGSASVAGVAYWVVHSKLKINCDFYFAIAENAIGDNAFRPGDILTARNGKTVEIHNTDAEGRLVLADSLTLAAESKPKCIIDIATLTGAIKFGLGSGVPGLFCNQDNLAECLLKAGQKTGDLSWRMPLIPEEKSRLKSDVADLVNCTSGFGGAVTAALFLEMFVEDCPWAHFDIYGWVDSAKGPYAAAGGSGQIVQSLSQFLLDESNNM